MSNSASEQHEHDCTECPLASRRSFIRDTATALGSIALSLGLAKDAFAAPVAMVNATVRSRGTHGETRTYPIPAADGAQIDRDAQTILVRWQNVVYAFALSCPHQNTALRWNQDAGRFQCPKHHSQYQPDGTFITGRATRGMDRLPIRREAQNVIVDIDAVYKQTDDPAGWAAAEVKLA